MTHEQNQVSSKLSHFPDVNSVLHSEGAKGYEVSTCEYSTLDLYGGSPELTEQFAKNDQKKQQQPATLSELSDLNTVDFSGGQLYDNLLEMAEEENKSNLDYTTFLNNRIIDIDEPNTINENFLTSYKLYTIRTRKNNSLEYDTSVLRRFSDFEFLQQQLLTRYGGCIIPVLPEKNFWTCLNMEGSEYVKMRVKRLLKYLNNLLMNPSIRQSKELKMFLFVEGSEFSQQKGQFEEKVKLQDKVYSFLSGAITAGQSFITGWFSRGSSSQQNQGILQTHSNLALAENQAQINNMSKAVIQWRKEITIRRKECVAISNIKSLIIKKENKKQTVETDQNFQRLQQNFEEMAEFIESCRQAINRRNGLAVELDNLKVAEQNTLRRNKNNPRSKEVDLLKTRIKKSQQTLERWTLGLRQEIGKAIHKAQEMYAEFLHEYMAYRKKLYQELFVKK